MGRRVSASALRKGMVLFFVVDRSSNPRVRVDKVSVIHHGYGPPTIQREGARWEGYQWGIDVFAEEEACREAVRELRPALVERLQRTVARANARLAKLTGPVQTHDPGKLLKAKP